MKPEHTFEDSIREVAAVSEAMRREAKEEEHQKRVREMAESYSHHMLDFQFVVDNRIYQITYKEVDPKPKEAEL